MYSFDEVGKVLGRITQQRMPAALASLELSRQAERIVTAAPALLAATTRTQHQEVSQTIAAEVERLDELSTELKGSAHRARRARRGRAGDRGPAAQSHGARRLGRQPARGGRAQGPALRRLSGTNIATQRLVAPGVLVMDSKLAEYRRAIGDAGVDEQTRRAAAGDLADEMTAFMRSRRPRSSCRRSTTPCSRRRAPRPRRPAAARVSAAPLASHARSAGQRVRRQASAAPARTRRGVPRLHRRGREHPQGARGGAVIVGQAQGLLAENVVLSRQVGDALDPWSAPQARWTSGAANEEGARSAAVGLGRRDRHGAAQPPELGPDRLAVCRSQPGSRA